jgi:hypothetical protein
MRTLLLVAALAACGGSEKPRAIEATPPTDDGSSSAGDEEEVDDGLEVQSTRGKMDPDDVNAGIEPHAQALQDCYLTRVGKQKWLGGKVELKWEISKDGALTGAYLVTSDLGAWPVEKCLLETARAMTFAKPKGGDADFTIPFEFTARGNAQWWDADMAANVVSKRVAELETCAKEAKVGDPTDVTVTLYVGTRGKVQSVGFSSPAPIEDAWADCAHAKVSAWTLTDPKGKVAKLAFVYREGQTPVPEEEW